MCKRNVSQDVFFAKAALKFGVSDYKRLCELLIVNFLANAVIIQYCGVSDNLVDAEMGNIPYDQVYCMAHYARCEAWNL